MKDGVDRSERDIFITTTITTGKVCSQQLIIIKAWRRCLAQATQRPAIGGHVYARIDPPVPVRSEPSRLAVRIRRMGDVEKEVLANADCLACIHRRGYITFNQASRSHQLGQAASGSRDKFTVWISRKHRYVVAVEVVENDA